MKSRLSFLYCTFCCRFGLSRGLLLNSSDFDEIKELSAQRPISRQRFVVSCRHCGVVFFARGRSRFVIARGQESIHSDDFLMCGLRQSVGKEELYREMVRDFRDLLDGLDLSNQLLALGNSVAVDLGSGIGALSEALSGKVRSVISIEPSSQELAFQESIHKRMGRDNILHVSSVNGIKGTRLANEAEILFAWHVIEHLEKPIDLLKSLREVFPNLRYVFGSVPSLSPRNITDHHDILLQECTLAVWLTKAGFRIIRLDYTNVLGYINFTAVPIHKGNGVCAQDNLRFRKHSLDELLLLQLFRSGIDASLLQGCIDSLEYRLSELEGNK
jgi:hypothetical protein